MKAWSIAGFIIAAIVLALAPALSTIYGEAYPAEPAKREALAACARSDPGFNRLFAQERASCYGRLLPAPPEQPPLVPRQEQVAGTAPLTAAPRRAGFLVVCGDSLLTMGMVRRCRGDI